MCSYKADTINSTHAIPILKIEFGRLRPIQPALLGTFRIFWNAVTAPRPTPSDGCVTPQMSIESRQNQLPSWGEFKDKGI